MTIDHSFTVAEALPILKLVDRTEHLADPRDARELARRMAEALEQPYRTVGAAFMPKKRGGIPEWQAEQIAERNDAYRDLAVAEYGTALLTPKQARALARKVRRLVEEVHFMEGGRSVQQDAVRRIRSSGLVTVGPRQLLRILPEKNCDIHLACLLVITDHRSRSEKFGSDDAVRRGCHKRFDAGCR